MSDLRRAVIKNADMSEEMQQEAVDVATTALSKYGIERDVAAHIKKEFDKKYHPTWHCIVGQHTWRGTCHHTQHTRAQPWQGKQSERSGDDSVATARRATCSRGGLSGLCRPHSAAAVVATVRAVGRVRLGVG